MTCNIHSVMYSLVSGGTTRHAHVRVVGAGRRRRRGAGLVAPAGRAQAAARRC